MTMEGERETKNHHATAAPQPLTKEVARQLMVDLQPSEIFLCIQIRLSVLHCNVTNFYQANY